MAVDDDSGARRCWRRGARANWVRWLVNVVKGKAPNRARLRAPFRGYSGFSGVRKAGVAELALHQAIRG